MAGILLYKIHVFAGAFWLEKRNGTSRGGFLTPPREAPASQCGVLDLGDLRFQPSLQNDWTIHIMYDRNH